MMDRDNITRTGAKDPWGSEARPRAQRHAEARLDVDSEPGHHAVADACEGSMQTGRCRGHAGSSLTTAPGGQARPDRLALKPYWGKLTVRNFREGDGNVGIMRSPNRAIALPDQPPDS
jgi:hypothetical protein